MERILQFLIFFGMFVISSIKCVAAAQYTWSYIGYYKDTRTRDLTGDWVQFDNNSVHVCTSWCFKKGFRYAALQYTRQCFCGDTYGKYGRLDAICYRQCPGNRTEICGGVWAQNIYHIIEVKTTSTAPTTSTTTIPHYERDDQSNRDAVVGGVSSAAVVVAVVVCVVVIVVCRRRKRQTAAENVEKNKDNSNLVNISVKSANKQTKDTNIVKPTCAGAMNTDRDTKAHCQDYSLANNGYSSLDGVTPGSEYSYAYHVPTDNSCDRVQGNGNTSRSNVLTDHVYTNKCTESPSEYSLADRSEYELENAEHIHGKEVASVDKCNQNSIPTSVANNSSVHCLSEDNGNYFILEKSSEINETSSDDVDYEMEKCDVPEREKDTADQYGYSHMADRMNEDADGHFSGDTYEHIPDNVHEDPYGYSHAVPTEGNLT